MPSKGRSDSPAGSPYDSDVVALCGWLARHHREGQDIAGACIEASVEGVTGEGIRHTSDRIQVKVISTETMRGGQAAVAKGLWQGRVVAVRAELYPVHKGTDTYKRRLRKMQLSNYIASDPELLKGQLPLLASFVADDRLDFGPDGAPVVVDLIEWGTPLNERIKRRKFSRGELEGLVAESLPMLRSMAHLYQKRRDIHRDLDLENCIYCDDGFIHVNDWGILREVGPEVDWTHTRAMGKWNSRFVAPELRKAIRDGERCVVGPHSDAWSIGCILAELYTGRPVVSRKGGDSHTSPPQVNRLPIPVRNVIRGLVNESPDKRMTVRDAHTQLSDWLAEALKLAPTPSPQPPPVPAPTTPPTPTTVGRRSPAAALAAVVAVFVVVGAIAFFGGAIWAWQSGDSRDSALSEHRPAGTSTQPGQSPGTGASSPESGNPNGASNVEAQSAVPNRLLAIWARAIHDQEPGRRVLLDSIGVASAPSFAWYDGTLTLSVRLRSLPSTGSSASYRQTCNPDPKAQRVQPGVYLVIAGTNNADIDNIRAATPWSVGYKTTSSLLRPAVCVLYLPGFDIGFPTPEAVRARPKVSVQLESPARFTFTVPKAGLRQGASMKYPKLVAGLVLVPERGPVVLARIAGKSEGRTPARVT